MSSDQSGSNEEEKLPEELYSGYVKRIETLQKSLEQKNVEISVLQNALTFLGSEMRDLKSSLKISEADLKKFKKEITPLKPNFLSSMISLKHLHGILTFLPAVEVFNLRQLNKYFYKRVKSYFHHETDNVLALLEQKQKSFQIEFSAIVPALQEARSALDSLTKSSITELMSYSCPPQTIVILSQAICILFDAKGEDVSWVGFRKIANPTQTLLSKLLMLDKDNISDKSIMKIEKLLEGLEFESIRMVSSAASCFFVFLKAIVSYHRLLEKMRKPKTEASIRLIKNLKENHWLKEEEENDYEKIS